MINKLPVLSLDYIRYEEWDHCKKSHVFTHFCRLCNYFFLMLVNQMPAWTNKKSCLLLKWLATTVEYSMICLCTAPTMKKIKCVTCVNCTNCLFQLCGESVTTHFTCAVWRCGSNRTRDVPCVNRTGKSRG